MGIGKKIKKVADNIGTYIENMTQDKDERAGNCVEHLNKEGIKLCNAQSNQEISQEQLSSIGIARLDDVGMITQLKSFEQTMTKYCLEEFAKHNFVPCNSNNIINAQASEKATSDVKVDTTPLATLIDSTKIYQAINGKVDNILIPNTPDVSYVSIGTTVKGSGKKVEGCKFIIRDFNDKDPDKINFSEFPALNYDELYISEILMNEKPGKAIHASGVVPEYIVCLYDNDVTLTDNLFIFAPQQGHEEL